MTCSFTIMTSSFLVLKNSKKTKTGVTTVSIFKVLHRDGWLNY